MLTQLEMFMCMNEQVQMQMDGYGQILQDFGAMVDNEMEGRKNYI